MMKNIPKIELDGKDASYRQIYRGLRDSIVSGKLQVGTRLPTIEALAKHWKTNYYTAQEALTLLAREGMIEKRPRTGTVVIRDIPLLTSVGVYFGDEFDKASLSFYNCLNNLLFRQLKELNIEPRLFVDIRPDDEKFSACPYLKKAVQKREIQGVIVCMVDEYNLSWLPTLPVPLSIFSAASIEFAINPSSIGMIETVFSQLTKRGCRTFSMFPTPETIVAERFREQFYQVLQSSNLEYLPIDGLEHPESYRSKTEWAYTNFHTFWKQNQGVDGLFVYPDVYTNGVTMAVLALGIKIPEDLTIIFHGNKEIPIYSPLKTDRIVLDVNHVASVLIQGLQAHIQGKPRNRVPIQFQLQPGY